MKRQRLGQHYLADRRVVDSIVSSAGIRRGERVLEIGTGRGILSKELAGLGASFEAYEIDPENHAATLEALEGAEATVRLGDAFAAEPSFDVLVSSLPYSRSADFIEWIARVPYSRAVVLLQADFVAKVTAVPGSRGYRAVSAITQISSHVAVLAMVPRGAFTPPPKVGSALVSFKPSRRMTRGEVALVKRLFSLRRREAASAAATLGMPSPDILLAKRRVYTLSPDEVMAACGFEGTAPAP
jgi:16S rRNA (adenine1518-N6/adenine1519-N6)-dimethyltransferase